MSFKPFNFSYIPPPTVTSITEVAQPANSTGLGQISLIAPLAKTTSQTLLDLVATSQYLQSLILAKFSNIGVQIDPNTDPVTGAALASIYTGTVPSIITTAMYSNLLDCQLALQSIDSALGPDSIAQADQYMLSNLIQINNTVANSLVATGGSDQLLIQSLSTLKNNAVLFSNLANNLSVYQGNTDLGSSVNSNLNALTTNSASLYASLNSLLTTANVINSDIDNVIASYALQPLKDVIAVTSAISLLYNTSYKKTASNIFGGLTSLVDTRLLAEVSVSYFAADQLVQRLLNPLKAMTGTIGQLVNSVNSSINAIETPVSLAKTTISNTTSKGIAGMSNCNPCSSSILNGLTGTKVPGISTSLSKVSKGNQFLAQHISAAMGKITSEFNQLESSFIALQKRGTAGFAGVLQTACAMSAAESLIAIGNNIISQSNSTKSSTPIPVPLTTATGITNTALSQTTTTVSVASNLSATSSLPIPSNVKAILTQGAVNNISGVINA
jgi:uncharacterized protein YoxC